MIEKLELEIGQLYGFYDEEGDFLGAGTFKGKWIDEIPRSCGCNGIDIDEVYKAVEL